MLFTELPIWKKHKGLILYLFFGALTTLIDTIVFMLCFKALHWPSYAANVVAWVLAVAFAFVTNKLWVFESRDFSPEVLWSELAAFVLARLFTLGVSTLMVYVGIDILHYHALAVKIVAGVIVIILNYVFSKLFIFKNPAKRNPSQRNGKRRG